MVDQVSEINEVLSNIVNLRHTLHLYSSDVNKYVIQAPFLASAERDERVVYVTQDDPARAREEFDGIDAELTVIDPSRLEKLKRGDMITRVLIDAGSIDPSSLMKIKNHRKRKALRLFFDHFQRERFLAENCENHPILCTYDLGSLRPDLIKEIAAIHDKLMLTQSDATILAAESFDRAGLDGEKIQQFVKDELESIVLALTLRKPMSGTDIIKTIHSEFDVFLSPGTIYPLLHDLEERELLKFECKAKAKTYRPAEDAEEKIRKILEEHVKASRFLSKFLMITGAVKKT